MYAQHIVNIQSLFVSKKWHEEERKKPELVLESSGNYHIGSFMEIPTAATHQSR